MRHKPYGSPSALLIIPMWAICWVMFLPVKLALFVLRTGMKTPPKKHNKQAYKAGYALAKALKGQV